MEQAKNIVHKVLEVFNLKGGVIMGIYSLAMIALSFYSVKTGKPIDGSVAAMYSTAALAFAGSKAHSNWLESKSVPIKPGEEKESD